VNRRLIAVALVLVAAALGLLAVDLWTGDDYDRTTVEIEDAETGERLATVDVRIADTFEKRYTGLSETDSLGPNEGMLFTYEEPGNRTYVMRNMSFAIDIVFIDADGTITTAYSAEPEAEPYTGYDGHGQYVLEVRYGYLEEHGIEVGDRVVIDDSP
jgi:uncharacterized membrane protein (UPF0127 family)